MSKRRPRLWYLYTLKRAYYINLAWALLIIYGMAVQSHNEIMSQGSHALFYYLPP